MLSPAQSPPIGSEAIGKLCAELQDLGKSTARRGGSLLLIGGRDTDSDQELG
ncbi:MAG: hypothetical protein QOF25_946 [Mycobacterium sp.]|nr:hypothetical protein [Mycobacterium sp.]